MTSPTPQNTDFSRDILGRYTCNGFDEALQSTDTSLRSDARPFNVVVIGGGSFAGVLAEHLLAADSSRRLRTLVLEAGRLALPEHVQNLPVLGLNPPGPTTNDPGVPRAEVWAYRGVRTYPKDFRGWPIALAAARSFLAAGHHGFSRRNFPRPGPRR
jgi:hypothetical protein